MTGQSSSPLLRIPPIVLFFAVFLVGLGIEALALGGPNPASASNPLFWVGIMLLFPAAYFGAGGWLLFLRRHLGLMPGHAITALVTDGPFRFSRNPMYFGLALLYLAACLLLGLPLTAILLLLPLAIMEFVVIPFEEDGMAEAFGATYADYCQRVRRWI